jgi:hypothetical protein
MTSAPNLWRGSAENHRSAAAAAVPPATRSKDLVAHARGSRTYAWLCRLCGPATTSSTTAASPRKSTRQAMANNPHQDPAMGACVLIYGCWITPCPASNPAHRTLHDSVSLEESVRDWVTRQDTPLIPNNRDECRIDQRPGQATLRVIVYLSPLIADWVRLAQGSAASARANTRLPSKQFPAGHGRPGVMSRPHDKPQID